MQAEIVIAIEYSIVIFAAVFAYLNGGRAERYGASWYGVNITASLIATLFGINSPVSHLVLDGIFALGLLPLAMVFVSYWVGVIALVSTALFGLEAVYLLNEWRSDAVYVWCNNSLLLLIPIVFIACGLASLLQERRSPRRHPQAADGNPVAG